MDNIKAKYDYIGDFNQGVAIVVKNNLYGVILMGGNEIIAPSYDYISPFKDGYAQAIRKGECKILNLSGRECKQYEGKLIAIPAKYDSVRDFKNGYACVQLNGKWGAIDVNCNEIYEPQFYFLSDFVGGTAKYKTEYQQHANSWGFLNTDGFRSECNLMEPEIESDGNLIIERYELSTDTNGSVFVSMVNNNPNRRVRINNKGQLLVKNGESMVALPKEFLIAKDFENGLAIVQDSTGYWGAVDVNGRIVITLQYSHIKNFSENKAFAINKNGKLCLISTNGTIIKEFDTYSDGYSFKGGYAVVSEGCKHGLINNNGKEILPPLDGYIHYSKTPHEFEITSSFFGGKHGLFMSSTGLLIKPRFNKIIEVKKDCVKVEVDKIGEVLIDLSGNVFVEKDDKRITFPDWCIGVKRINENIFIGITDNGRWGLLDGSGETLCKPTFDNIGEVDNDIIPLIKKETITVDGWRKETKEIIKYGLYNIESKVSIPIEYDVCPEYIDGFYKTSKNGLYGVINENGDVILKPEWKQVKFSNGYFLVSKITKEDYIDKEKFGLVDEIGDIIFEAKYDDIEVVCDGLYKIKENHSWSIYNENCRLTKDFYDDIYLEDDFFIVSKNGLKGRLNKKGEQIIMLDDGSYMELPSRFAWGYDFKNGVAKVLINKYENYVDTSFNIVVINNESSILVDKSIDYIVTKDDASNYIFASEKKYGLINNAGKIIIDAKYNYLFPLANNMYIASILKDGDYRSTYGIIDMSDKIILAFEYSSIKPYGGKIPRSYWSWDDEYITEQVEIPEEVQHWLVHKNGYGLIDRNGKICIPSEYNDIQKFENGFFVKSNGKYGVIDSDYNIICDPKYSTIKPIGNGLWKVSIVISQTYDRKNEVYGILDSYGKERLEPIYNFIGEIIDFREPKGRAIIHLKGVGLVDENYRIIAEPQYEHVSEFKNGKATVTKRVFKQNMPGVEIVRGEIDINGVFTDICEVTNLDVRNLIADRNVDSSIRIVKTLKNGYVVVQKEDSSPIYQYCAILDKDNNIILPYKYHGVEELENGMFIVFLRTGYRDNFGLLNKDFKEVIPSKYAYIRQLQDVFIASANGNYYGSQKNVGLIDSNDNVILQFDYSAIESAAPGLVWIHKEQKIGLATTKGEVLLVPQYGKVEPFTNGYAKVNNGYWYEYDKNDDSPVVHTITEYHEGKWGLISSEGILILPSIYDSVRVLEDTQIIVSRQIRIKSSYSNIHVSGVTNYQGELLIKDSSGNYILASKKYDWQEDFNTEGQSRVYYNGNIGVVNEKFQQIVTCQIKGKTSEFVLPEEYDWGYNSTSQFVLIEKNGKKGIIDCANSYIVIKPVFDQLDVLNDNTSFVFKCGVQNKNNNSYRLSYTWSIIKVDGKPVIDIQSEDIIHLGFSLLAVKNNNKYSLVDFNGQSTSETSFDAVLCFGISSSNPDSWETPKKVDGLNFAIVGIDGLYGLIDKQGRLVIVPKHTSLTILENGCFWGNGVLYDVNEKRVIANGNSVVFVPDDYVEVQLLDNGLILASSVNGNGCPKWGCVNQVGTTIIPFIYGSLTYSDGFLLATICDDYYLESKAIYVQKNKKFGVINFKNEIIVPFSDEHEQIQIKENLILLKNKHNINLCGAYTRQGAIICEPIYKAIVPISQFALKVYKETGKNYQGRIYKWGVIDFAGNEILPFEYDSIADKPDNGLLKVQKNSRYGFIDVMGNMLLKPTYCSIGNFNHGYAIVSREEDFNQGVIDSKLNEVIPCHFSKMEYIEESHLFETEKGYKDPLGRYHAESNGKEVLVPSRYSYCESFNNGFAIAVLNKNWYTECYGLINDRAADTLPPIFESLILLDNGLYKFKLNGKYGLIDNNGSIILPNKYHAIGEFIDNLACVRVSIKSVDSHKETKFYGYVDLQGNEVLPIEYEFIGKRFNNRAVIMKGGEWWLFGIDDHKLTAFHGVAHLGPCVSDDLCKVNIGGKYDKEKNRVTGGLYGYCSIDGKAVIEASYESVYGFSEGLAAVKMNGKWGFINTSGEFVVPCKYDEVDSSYKDGSGRLTRGQDIFVFDYNGNLTEHYTKEEDGNYYETYDDDTPSIYDNPYYNDNLDMDQQSIEFWNSL